MKKILFFIIPVMLLTLTGCLTIRQITSGTKWEDNAIFLIEKGKTTAKDIAYAFGSPQKEIMGGNKGRVWIYFYDIAKYLYEGSIRRGMIEGEHYSLTIWFNKDGIVTDYSLTYNKFEDPDLKSQAERIEKNMQEEEVQQ